MTGRREPGAGRAGRGWAALAWGMWALVVAGLGATLWMDVLLRRTGRPDLVSIDGDAIPYLLAMASAAAALAGLAVAFVLVTWATLTASLWLRARP